VEIQRRIEHGSDVARTIGRYAVDHEADLVVLGTRGRGAADVARLGSVAASVMLHVTVPTLLVPPAVWRAHASSMTR
jgi:nucleotide-binding universal stress UspA family protein